MRIIIEGHDCSGKTTISKKIELYLKSLGYKTKVISPFCESYGNTLIELYNEKKYEELYDFASNRIENLESSENPEYVYIYDRHWISVFTLLPYKYRKQELIRKNTILCWADYTTTIERFKERNPIEIDEWNHQFFIDLYLQIAYDNKVEILNTSNNIKCSNIDNIIFSKVEGMLKK